MLLEWLFEARPGPVGRVDVAAPSSRPLPLWMVLMRAAFAAVVLVTALRAIAGADRPVMASLAFAMYLLVSFVIRPRPDETNTGIFGFIDHPFKWTDDANRFLVFLRVALLPGRLTTAAIRDLFAVALGRRQLSRPPEAPGR